MSAETTKRVKRLPRTERIQDIMKAARTAFAVNGYHQASMAEIAASAGVAEGTIYKFFDSKRSLLLAILRDWYDAMIRENSAKLAGVKGTRARLRVAIWQHLSVIQNDPDLCRLFYAEVRSQADYPTTELFQLNKEATRLLVTALEDGIRDGDVRPDIDLRLVRDVVFGGIEHHVSRFLAGHGDLDVGRLSDGLTELAMCGVGQRSKDKSSVDQVRFEKTLDRLVQLVDRMDQS